MKINIHYTIKGCSFILSHIATKKPVASSKAAPGGSKTTAKGSTTGVGGKAGGGGKQKRSPWDLKGRLQDMESMMADERKYSTNTIGDLQTQVLPHIQYIISTHKKLKRLT